MLRHWALQHYSDQVHPHHTGRQQWNAFCGSQMREVVLRETPACGRSSVVVARLGGMPAGEQEAWRAVMALLPLAAADDGAPGGAPPLRTISVAALSADTPFR